jgi:glycosyltransferase involved in cell wall biosynthesis
MREEGAGSEPEVSVSVLIPVLDEERHLRTAAAAMQRQQFDGLLEFLFVDGRSTDASRAILEELAAADPRIRVLDNPARRTAAGLNVALRAARGRYIARMDAHSVYPERYLQRGVDRLERGDDDGVVWVTGPQLPVGDGPWSERVVLALTSWIGRGGEADKWPGAVDGDAQDEFPLTTSVFTGVWRRADVDRLGGWDEGWPVNQDAEMAARILTTGGRIVCRPDMGAQYVPRDSPRALARQYGRYGFYRAKTFLRHPSSLPRSRWLSVGVVGALLGSLVPVRLISWPSRTATAVYLTAIAVISARAAPRAGRHTIFLPVVYVTMHVSWGVGFLLSLAKHLPRRAALQAWPRPLERDEA